VGSAVGYLVGLAVGLELRFIDGEEVKLMVGIFVTGGDGSDVGNIVWLSVG